MPPRTLHPTADALVLARMYVEATRQYDSTPATDKALRAVLAGRRLGAAVQLAEELAPLLTDSETPFTARLTPIPPPPKLVEPDATCPVEEQARAGAAQDLRGTVGTVGAAKAAGP